MDGFVAALSEGAAADDDGEGEGVASMALADSPAEVEAPGEAEAPGKSPAGGLLVAAGDALDDASVGDSATVAGGLGVGMTTPADASNAQPATIRSSNAETSIGVA